MATKITQSLLENKLQQQHLSFYKHLNSGTNVVLDKNPQIWNFSAMNGQVYLLAYTNSNADSIIELYKLVGSSWVYQDRVRAAGRPFGNHKNTKSKYIDITPGFYQIKQGLDKSVVWRSEYVRAYVYKTNRENHIKGNKLRLINDSFTGYEIPSRDTVITMQHINDGRVCTY